MAIQRQFAVSVQLSTLVRGSVMALGVAAVLSLTACDYGEATGVSNVTDISATLHGDVHSSDPTPKYWFEYDTSPEAIDGKLTFANATPPNEWACCGPMTSASRTIEGLTADTPYHYRFCIETESGGGLCGASDSFTTRPDDRDVVDGTIYIPVAPELGANDGVAVSVRAEPDGSLPIGEVSRVPGSFYFRWPDSGPATCLRIEGNRAAIGFDAIDTTGSGLPPVPQVVFVEDNGPTGDRFTHLLVAETPTTCPDPDDASITWKVAEEGDLVITDNP